MKKTKDLKTKKKTKSKPTEKDKVWWRAWSGTKLSRVWAGPVRAETEEKALAEARKLWPHWKETLFVEKKGSGND